MRPAGRNCMVNFSFTVNFLWRTDLYFSLVNGSKGRYGYFRQSQKVKFHDKSCNTVKFKGKTEHWI